MVSISSTNAREHLGDAAFSITARIALQLGRESISNSVVAILELVKNAYDADAENVWISFKNLRSGSSSTPQLIIDDDGNGMTRSQLENSWLIIGVDTKKVVSKSRKKNRILTGEKGLGRLGLDRLCARTRVQTFTQDEASGLEIDIDWTKYEATNAKLESITHDMFLIPKQILDIESQTEISIVKGTRLTLEELKDDWAEYDISRLWTELALLVSPFAGLNDFSIHLFTDGTSKYNGKVSSDNLLDAAEWKVVSELTKGDTGEFYFNFDMTSTRHEASFHEGPTPWSRLFPQRTHEPACGPVRCELYYMPRDEVPAKSLKRSQIANFLDNNQGVRIYRDNFRVMPYGQPSGDGDWLGLGLRRTTNPTPVSGPIGSWRIGYNQIVGAVFIHREQNSVLIDQTNREGIVEGNAYLDLRLFALKSVETLEINHQRYVHAQGPKPNPQKNTEIVKARSEAEKTSRASLEALEQLKAVAKTTAQILVNLPTDTPSSEEASAQASQMLDILESLEKSVDEQQGKQEQLVRAVDKVEEERQEEFQRQKDTLGNLASLGILATTFGHETAAASNLVVGSSGELKSHIEQIPWLAPEVQAEIQQHLDIVVDGARRINTFAEFTLKNVARDKRFRKKIFLDKVIRRVFKSFTQALEQERHITVAFDFPLAETIPGVNAFNIDWESIIVNFITNSVWALENTPAEDRKIRVRLSHTDDYLMLDFADSGCGIAAGTEDSIFEPTFTTKRNKKGDLIGTGMGLAIVQIFVESYGGKITLEPRSDLGGAQFVIQIPLRNKAHEEDNNG